MITDIIHAGISNGSIRGYACNMACGYHPHKVSWDWKNVTCKNCLNLMQKYSRYTGSNNDIIMLKKKSNQK